MISLKDDVERVSTNIIENGKIVCSRTGMIREIIGMEIGFNLEKVLDELDPVDYLDFQKLLSVVKFPIKVLKQSLNSRRALIFLSERENYSETECINVVQFLIRYGYLHVVVFARSIDVGHKLFDDVVAVGRVAVRVLDEFNLKPGSLRFYIGSAHLYIEKF